MEHKLMTYLNLINMKKIKILILSILALLIFSCSSNDSSEFYKIKDYFEKVHNYKITEKISRIVVITEGNACPSCDNAFSNFVFNKLKNENTLFLITATGRFMSIEPFLHLEKNCYFDWQLDKAKYPEFTSSRVIYLKNNEIDTTIILDANTLLEQLKYIEDRE